MAANWYDMGMQKLPQCIERYIDQNGDYSALFIFLALRAHQKTIFNSVTEKIKDEINGHDVYFIVNETSDKVQRKVANVLLGKLNGEKAKSMLIDVAFHSTVDIIIQECILNVSRKMWPNDLKYSKLKLIVTDRAKYTMKAASEIKKNSLIFPNVHHVTCLAHALHNVAFNKFAYIRNEVFVKSRVRQNDFKNATGVSNLPPEPIVTRWGSWLNAAKYNIDNFDTVECFILNYKRKSHLNARNVSVKLLQEKKVSLKKELFDLRNLVKLSNIISLEEQGLNVTKQAELIENAKEIVSGCPIFSQKLEKVLSSNPDLIKFTSFDVNLSGKVNSEYTPLVAVDVERWFSLYSSILSDRRHSLSENHLKYLSVIRFN
ncbi:uncharacterized protein [Centruroides vittatus]|uniref:uncharacterized protein n=1 Tax=Centruroides vittatus TaxID=120091 RepID=UPI00350EFF8E